MSEQKLAAVRAAYVKLGERLDELEAEMNQVPAAGKIAKDLVARFVVLWGQKYHGQTYVITAWPKEIASMKRLLKVAGSADIERRMSAYLASSDRFYADARHPLGLFVAAFNKFNSGPASASPDEFLTSAPADCRHVPPCRSDEAHTARKNREMRR